jgi:hypothetical protein
MLTAAIPVRLLCFPGRSAGGGTMLFPACNYSLIDWLAASPEIFSRLLKGKHNIKQIIMVTHLL